MYGEPLSYLGKADYGGQNTGYNTSKQNNQNTSYTRTSGSEFAVTFRIYYKSRVGEDLFVRGDVPELGDETELKRHPLKWTDGHIWVSEKPFLTRTPIFRYSYIMIDASSGKQVHNDEKGIKRICDLATIETASNSPLAGLDNRNNGFTVSKSGGQFHVNINDTWRFMKIKFTVLHTQIHGTQSIRITGDIPELGNWNKSNPIQLSPELTGKSEELIPYSLTVDFEVPVVNQAFNIRYSYSLWEDNNNAEWEREPARTLSILPSEGYNG